MKRLALLALLSSAPAFAILGSGGSWIGSGGGGGGGTPGGSNTQVQFNDSGVFGGNAGLTFSKTSGLLNVGGNVTAGGSLINFGQINLGGAGTGTGLSMNADATSGQANVLLNNLDGSPGFSFGYFQSGNQFFLSDNVSTQFMTVDRSTGEVNFSGDVNVNSALGVSTSLYVSGTSTLDSGDIFTDGAGDLTLQSLTVNSDLYVADATRLDSGDIFTDGAGNLTVNTLNPNYVDAGTGGVFSSGQITGNGGGVIQGGFTTDLLTINNKLAVYGGVLTAGYGQPVIFGNVSLTARTASIGTTNLINAGGNASTGLYRLGGYVECTTAGTAGDTLTVTITYHDDNGAQSITPISTMSMSTKGFTPINDIPIRSAGGNTINYATTLSSIAGNPQYALFLTLERVQ